MQNNIPAQVIDFFQIRYPQTIITAETTFESLGIEGDDRVNIIMELEDSFGITSTPKDTDGIYTVGESIALIERKI